MRTLSNEKRRLSIDAAENLANMATRAKRRGHTAEQIQSAIVRRDAKALAVYQSDFELSFKQGSPDEIGSSLAVLSACAEINHKGGLPLVIELDSEAVQHTQAVLAQMAESKTEPRARAGLNPALVQTEVFGRLLKRGILRVDAFAAFAGPVHGALKKSSPTAAKTLRGVIANLQKPRDVQNTPTPGEIEAKKAEEVVAKIRLDGDVGGRKPASPQGPLAWKMAEFIRNRTA